MGKKYAAFLPLDESTVFVFSLQNAQDPLRIFAKRPDWQAPKLISELAPGKSTMLGQVKLTYVKVLPVTGLQYKCDPGLPITYVAFGFIMLGVMLATVPHRFVWAALSESEVASGQTEIRKQLAVGGRSVKARVGFERSMQKLMQSIRNAQSSEGAPTIDSGQTKPGPATTGACQESGQSAKELVTPRADKEVSR
jgi:cytochrome c biogenesis protein ResB